MPQNLNLNIDSNNWQNGITTIIEEVTIIKLKVELIYIKFYWFLSFLNYQGETFQPTLPNLKVLSERKFPSILFVYS